MSDTVPSIRVVYSPDWLLYSGKMEVSELNGTEKAYLRRAYCASGVRVLDGSRLLRRCGEKNKAKMAEAFVDLIESGDEPTYEAYRLKAQSYGIPLIVIVFLLNIAWQILWHWWTNRDK